MNAPEPRPSGGAPSGQAPLPNRFTRTTALGCLGIAGIFALPALLFLPLEDWHLPGWVLQLVVLAAFAALAAGVWLLARLPSGRALNLADARRPMTRAGQPPIVERPAQAGNRIVAFALAVLAVVAAAGYLAAGVGRGGAVFGLGVTVVGIAGALGVALGIAVAARRLPVPAWRWTRLPIQARSHPLGILIALFSAAAVCWALLGAAGAGYAWGAVGLAALVLACVLLPPLAQRWSRLAREGGDHLPPDAFGPAHGPDDER